jgi:uncharacterized glyoxalase superfamily protein PhnB
MSRAAHQPAGWPTVTPRIITPDVEGLARFVEQVLEAEVRRRPGAPVEARIGDSLVMISEGEGLREPRPAFLYVYVPDADTTFRRAIAAGATAIEEPRDLPYGDRRAMVRDAWGNDWQFATRLGA